MKKIILFLFLSTTSFFAQRTDSLKNTLANFSGADTQKVNLMNSLASQLCNENPTEAVSYAMKAEVLSRAIDFITGEANANYNQGRANSLNGDNSKALEKSFKAYSLFVKSNEKRGILKSLLLISSIYSMQENYESSFKYALMALKVAEELGDKKRMGACYLNISKIYIQKNELAEALSYSMKSLKLAEETQDKMRANAACNNIGTIYFKQGDFEKANEYYLKCVKNAEDMGNKYEISTAYRNLGMICREQNNISKAIESLKKSLVLSEEIGDKYAIAETHFTMGTCYVKAKKNTDAKKELQIALSIAENLGAMDLTAEIYSQLASSSEATGDFKSANLYQKKAGMIRDSILNEETTRKLVKTQMQAEFEKKEMAIKMEQEKLDMMNSQQLKKQKSTLWMIIGGIVVLGIAFIIGIVVLIVKLNKKPEKKDDQFPFQNFKN